MCSKHYRCLQIECEGFIATSLDNEKQENVKCPSCKKAINIAEMLILINSYFDDFDKGISLMNRGNIEEAINVMCMFSDLMHGVCVPPVKKVSLCHEALRSCWSAAATYAVKGSE